MESLNHMANKLLNAHINSLQDVAEHFLQAAMAFIFSLLQDHVTVKAESQIAILNMALPTTKHRLSRTPSELSALQQVQG